MSTSTPNPPDTEPTVPQNPNPKKPKRTLFQRLRRWFFIFAFLGMLGLLALSFFAVPLAQMGLDRLRSRGLKARVYVADFFRGRVGVRRLRLRQRQKAQKFRLKAGQATLQLNLWQLLFGRFREISTLEVHAPSIVITRTSGVVKQTSPAQRKRRWRKVQRALRGNAGTLLHIVNLRIVRGDITFLDKSNPRRKVRVHVGRISTRLRQWKGTIRLKQVTANIDSPGVTLRVKVPAVTMGFHLKDFLTSDIPVLRLVKLQNPDIFVHKSNTKRRKRSKQVNPGIQIQQLQIERGRLRVKGILPGRRKMNLRVARINGKFQDFKGLLKFHRLQMKMNGKRRWIRFKAPYGRVFLNLREMHLQTLPLDKIFLLNPTIRLKVRGKPQRRKPRKWILIRNGTVQNGLVSLDSKRMKRGKMRHVQLRLSKIKAKIQGLDIHQWLARPFGGKGQMYLQELGPVVFNIRKLSHKSYHATIPRLPLQALLRIKGGKPLPIAFYSGYAKANIRFTRTKRELWVDSSFQLQRMALKVTLKKRGLKRLLLRGAARWFNKKTFALPNGYKLKASFVLDDSALFDDPRRLMRALGKKWVAALLDSLARKHKLIARLKPMLLKRMQGNASKAKKANLRTRFQQWREDRKKKRELRREKRRKKWAAIKKKWKKGREERKQKRKKRIQKLKTRFQKWREKRKQRWQRWKDKLFKKKKQ